MRFFWGKQMKSCRVFLVTALFIVCASCSFVHVKKQIHPILRESQKWRFVLKESYCLDDSGSAKFIWLTSTFFDHPNGQWFLGTHEVFGKLVIKGYGIRRQNGDLLEHYIQIKKDAKWITLKSNYVSFDKVYNDNFPNKITDIFVSARDNQGKVVGGLFKRNWNEKVCPQ